MGLWGQSLYTLKIALSKKVGSINVPNIGVWECLFLLPLAPLKAQLSNFYIFAKLKAENEYLISDLVCNSLTARMLNFFCVYCASVFSFLLIAYSDILPIHLLSYWYFKLILRNSLYISYWFFINFFSSKDRWHSKKYLSSKTFYSMGLSSQSSINIIDIKVGLQNLVFKYHCSLKINQGFLETWLIPDLGQGRYNKHLEHLDILEKMLSEITRVI